VSSMRARAGKAGVALLFLLAHSACVGTAAPSAADPASSSAGHAGKAATIADASAACQRLQADAEIPVTCTTDYVENVPSMIVGFRSLEEARQYMAPFAEHIGNPFCEAAQRSGREARVYMTVGSGDAQRARKWSCELGKWGEWFANLPPSDDASAQTIADAVRACDAVQANRDVPVSCHTADVNGMSAMIVGFANAEAAEAYMPQVAEHLAGPFCEAANGTNLRAALFITLGAARARHYDCQHQQWGDWFELSPGNAVDEASLQEF
jgi:hypothetical protein